MSLLTMALKTVIDNNAGFCFGVVNAIGTAEAELLKGGTLYCLGDIVHNSAEVKRLHDLGLQAIDHQYFRNLKGSEQSKPKVLIRAHGEPRSTYVEAEQRNIRIVDATCPIVLALQRKIRAGYDEMKKVDGQVVIFGKPGHAEVIGLNGQTDNSSVIVSSPADIDGIDLNRPIRLYSQTTKSKEDYELLIANIRNKVVNPDFIAYNTICTRVSNRASELQRFARGHDVILFVCGNNSSNGQYLYEYCKKVNPKTYRITGVSEIDPGMFDKASLVGITGATSTPRWLMEDVEKYVKQI